MTTGTLLAFVVTGIIVLVAIVGGIWLETRLPGPHDRRRSPPGEPPRVRWRLRCFGLRHDYSVAFAG
jgi:hypothetical protein